MPTDNAKMNPNQPSDSLSRRKFLEFATLVGGASVLGTTAVNVLTQTASAASPTSPTKAAEHQWVMIFDLRRCEGCVTTEKAPQCVEGCNAEHFVPKGQEWLKVFEMEGPGGHSYFLPRPCMQCENPPCVMVCPVQATYRTAEGVVLINHERCIGCRMCMAACPYSARSFNWGEPENPAGATFAKYSPEYPVPHRRGTVEKCMFCAHRMKDGKLPACADACPMYAIYFGDLMQDIATNGKEVVKLSLFLAENNAYRLKEELGTRPRIWYIPGHGQEYGHHVTEHRHPKPARNWQQMGATIDDPHGAHK